MEHLYTFVRIVTASAHQSTAKPQQCTAIIWRRHMLERENIIASLFFVVFNLEKFCMVAVDLL